MKGRIQVAKYVLALDQGTTSSRAIVFDKKGNIVAKAQKEFDQIYPAAGWVEHDPMEILFSQFQAVTSVFASGGIKPEDIAAIGITNQRETTIMWDRETGKPVYNAIVWQCRRTAELCEQIKADGMEEYIKDKTGLVIDAYFSGTKIKWILDNVPGARRGGSAALRHGRDMAHMESHRRQSAYNRLFQRIENDALRCRQSLLGREDVRISQHPDVHSARGQAFEHGIRQGRRRHNRS